jgi:gamma-glutamylcyclotransferase (GGCT)/AIG2-like uncharacterized protein YtfP
MPLMFLNGGAMRGGPLHHLLRDAPFVATVRTAPRYRFYSVGDRFPAITEVDSRTVIGEAVPVIGEGVSVLGELYDVPWDVLRDSLLPAEPAELELGVIELEDGSGTLSMVLRRGYCPEGSPAGLFRDISEYADWRGYTASLGAATMPPGE